MYTCASKTHTRGEDVPPHGVTTKRAAQTQNDDLRVCVHIGTLRARERDMRESMHMSPSEHVVVRASACGWVCCRCLCRSLCESGCASEQEEKHTLSKPPRSHTSEKITRRSTVVFNMWGSGEASTPKWRSNAAYTCEARRRGTTTQALAFPSLSHTHTHRYMHI